MDAETRAERLKQLRRVVSDTPNGQFTMSCLGKRTNCGTVACAAGWARQDPWHLANTDIGKILQFDLEDGFLRVMNGVPLSTQLANLYGLEWADSQKLFGVDGGRYRLSLVTKAHVIANIDRLLSGLPALSYGDPALLGEAVAQ